MNNYDTLDSVDRLPYFGAILTDKGKKALIVMRKKNRKKNELMEKEIMEIIKDDPLIYSCIEASKARLFHNEHPDWVNIIDNMVELESVLGVEFEAPDLPYFGAFLTDKGKRALVVMRKKYTYLFSRAN